MVGYIGYGSGPVLAIPLGVMQLSGRSKFWRYTVRRAGRGCKDHTCVWVWWLAFPAAGWLVFRDVEALSVPWGQERVRRLLVGPG